MTTRDKRSTATKAKLIRHGARLFAQHGYEGASVDAITRAANVNKAMISYHFGGKQGLYSAVLLASIRSIADQLAPARDRSLAPPERLRLFIACLVQAFDTNPEFPFIVLREEMAGGGRIEADVIKEFIGFYELDREILEAGMESGDFRKVVPHEVHLSIIGSLAFFLASQPLRSSRLADAGLPRAPAFDSYVTYVTDVFLQGLRNLGDDDNK